MHAQTVIKTLCVISRYKTKRASKHHVCGEPVPSILREASVWCLPLAWNLRAATWFPFHTSSGSSTEPYCSFSANGPLSWLFINIFSRWAFLCTALVQQVGDGRWYVQLAVVFVSAFTWFFCSFLLLLFSCIVLYFNMVSINRAARSMMLACRSLMLF